MPKRIFISFAMEDVRIRDLVVGQSLATHTPFEFHDFSVKEPWDDNWKTRCRTKIRGCDGVIAILTANTIGASGACWEIKCASEEQIPLIGMYAYKEDINSIALPMEIYRVKKISWNYGDITAFIDGL